MNTKQKRIFWWVIVIVFTLSIAFYQKLTGPTYPVRGKLEVAQRVIKYKLPRSNDSHIPAEVIIKGVDAGMKGELKYKKYKSGEAWTAIPMIRENDNLLGYLPEQPPAGKLMYEVNLFNKNETYSLSADPVVIRFKGNVPLYVLLPHIFFMFFAMLFSTRTGIEALINGDKISNYAFVTLFSLLIGGMILGPVVQKFAFGAYWTGWPFGQDLTDNKTLVGVIAWLIAFIRIRKDKTKKGWVLAASVILLAVYLIPHSMFGSELDYSTGEVVTGE